MGRGEKTYGPAEFLDYMGVQGPKDDEVHVIRYEEHADLRLRSAPVRIGFYFISIKENLGGRHAVDGMSDAYVFLDRPGNTLEWDFAVPFVGYALLVNRELLGKHAKDYGFLDYSAHEALYLTKDERAVLLDLFRKAHAEFGKEGPSREILVSYATLMLSYARTFYERQFAFRSKLYNRVVADFYGRLEQYFNADGDVAQLPTVTHFAQQANLSVNYFGDLIKHYTGSSPQDHIHQHIIQLAKSRLRHSQRTVSEIAYSLGFEYPTYFTRFFRKETGITPTVFRSQ
ncbi:MAG: AraC family transcriptional regulator [Bacteroidetes bacterium]|nr:AraC family transcriptional regulator [Bacteroidota bacterium]